nr:MAG TPA: hypothetical protein [Caudoviricetes sp.]
MLLCINLPLKASKGQYKALTHSQRYISICSPLH